MSVCSKKSCSSFARLSESEIRQDDPARINLPNQRDNKVMLGYCPSPPAKSVFLDLHSALLYATRAYKEMFSVDECLANISKSKVFWQLLLHKKPSLLTTLVWLPQALLQSCPFKNQLSAKVFPRTMFSILQGLDGVICHIDDALVYGKTQE